MSSGWDARTPTTPPAQPLKKEEKSIELGKMWCTKQTIEQRKSVSYRKIRSRLGPLRTTICLGRIVWIACVPQPGTLPSDFSAVSFLSCTAFPPNSPQNKEKCRSRRRSNNTKRKSRLEQQHRPGRTESRLKRYARKIRSCTQRHHGTSIIYIKYVKMADLLLLLLPNIAILMNTTKVVQHARQHPYTVVSTENPIPGHFERGVSVVG